jgi:hypothetical protein
MSKRYSVTRGETVGGVPIQDGWRVVDLVIGTVHPMDYDTKEAAEAAALKLERESEQRMKEKSDGS